MAGAFLVSHRSDRREINISFKNMDGHIDIVAICLPVYDEIKMFGIYSWL